MDTSAIAALTLAAATGIGAIAFKRPRVYRNAVFVPLFLGFLACVLLVSVWHIGLWEGWSLLLPLLANSDQIQKARDIIEAHSLPLVASLEYGGGAVLYLVMLVWLAQHVIDDQERERSKGE